MTFKPFTSNGWIDESCKYVIVANPDTKTFEIRYYKDGFNVSNLLLNIDQPYSVLGTDIKDDSDAVKLAEEHMNSNKTYIPIDTQSIGMTKAEELLCDIAHLILDTLEK